MSSWKTTLKDVGDSLGCIYHLIKEEHSDVVEPVTHVTIDKKTVIGGDSNGNDGQKTFNEVNNILRASFLLDNESAWDRAKYDQPTSSAAAVENQPPSNSENKIIRIVRRIVVPSRAEWMQHLQTGVPIPLVEMVKVDGDLEGKTINPESLRQVFQKHAITPSSMCQDLTDHDETSSSPSSSASVSPPPRVHQPRHHSPIPQYFEQPQANDPFLFHTNAYDSPPPSPGHETEDYEYNMRPDPNGAIPDFIDVGVQENNNTAQEPKYCHLPLCEAFHHLLHTTPENVGDKQNVLKELFHHSDSLMRQVVEQCPAGMTEEFVELAASIVLINNSLQRSTDYQSYTANSKIVESLVAKVRTVIQKIM